MPMFDGRSEQSRTVQAALEQALDRAIANAGNALQTDAVRWTIDKISGTSGGFTHMHTVSVRIEATGPAGI